MKPFLLASAAGVAFLLCMAGSGQAGTVKAEPSCTVDVGSGSSRFMIERGGRHLTVTVAEGKVTPVVVNYELLDTVCEYDVCRIETEVLEPVPESERKPAASDKQAKG